MSGSMTDCKPHENQKKTGKEIGIDSLSFIKLGIRFLPVVIVKIEPP